LHRSSLKICRFAASSGRRSIERSSARYRARRNICVESRRKIAPPNAVTLPRQIAQRDFQNAALGIVLFFITLVLFNLHFAGVFRQHIPPRSARSAIPPPPPPPRSIFARIAAQFRKSIFAAPRVLFYPTRKIDCNAGDGEYFLAPPPSASPRRVFYEAFEREGIIPRVLYGVSCFERNDRNGQTSLRKDRAFDSSVPRRGCRKGGRLIAAINYKEMWV